MTQSELFELLGAPLANSRWSWGSVREDKAVFLKVWQDKIQEYNGIRYVQVGHVEKYEDNASHPGHKERLKHVEQVRNGAPCYMVMCEATDASASPRQVNRFNQDELFVGGEIREIDGDWWVELLRSIPIHEVAPSSVLYFNNCKNRDHVELFGPDAFYDLNTTGVQGTQATDLQSNQECVVATASDDRVTFSWYSFLRETVLPDKKTGVEVRVLFGKFITSETLSKADAALEQRYSAFFNVMGNFKRLSVISSRGQAPRFWLPPESAGETGAAEEPYVIQDGDRRPLVNRQIRERRGQQQFREALRQRYGDRCLVTGCKVLAVLEAAHVSPYRGEGDNNPVNGLLLRADIHTLFDLDLLGINPKGLLVELHPTIVGVYG